MSARAAYFDCFSGASGDMILGALVDAGLPIEDLAGDIEKLHCGPIHITAEKVMRCGIGGTKVRVHVPGPGDHEDAPQSHHHHEHDHDNPEHEHHHHHEHRGLPEIRKIIEAAGLPEIVKQNALGIFTRLGEAEAAIHQVPLEQIHFHEVGALDAIADITGAAAGLERLGIKKVHFSKLRVGGGSVKAGHGVLPVPAPATARLIEGIPWEPGPVNRELLTPTGAAILTTLGQPGWPAEFRPDRTGYGAGNAELPGHPNLLRVFIGEAEDDETSDSVWVLQANLDDSTAEICGYAIERLMAGGALDAFAQPIQMKKSRPAWLLSAIVEDAHLQAAEDILFRETTTFGIRRHRVERSKLRRDWQTVETPWGQVRVKIGRRGDEILTVAPEFEDCRLIAEEKNIPLREVMRIAAQMADGMRS